MSNAHRFARLGTVAALVAAIPLAAAQDAAPRTMPETAHAQAQAQQDQDQQQEEPAQQDSTDEAGEQRRVEALREVSAQRRDEAVATARRAAEDLDRQMETLQRQMDEGWDRMSEVARARSRASMADLRQRRNALAEWLGGMRHSSGAAWSEVRSGFVKSYQELAEAMRRARAEFARDDADRAPEPSDPAADDTTRTP